MSQLFYIGVKGLIRNIAGDYLLLKANTANHSTNIEPYWDIPGGRIEEGEEALATLKREIFEETGITQLSSSTFLTSVISHHKIPIGGDKIAGLALFVYTVNISADIKIVLDPNEHTEYAWFDATRAADLLSNKYPPEFTATLA